MPNTFIILSGGDGKISESGFSHEQPGWTLPDILGDELVVEPVILQETFQGK